MAFAFGLSLGADISGTVSDAINKGGIANSNVRVSGTAATKAFEKYVTTDNEGGFHLEVPVGRFHVSATATGFATPRMGNSVDVTIDEDSSKSMVRLQLYRNATLTGTLIDEETRLPISNMPVAARRTSYLRGHRQLWVENAGNRTAKDGSFRLEKLPPGDYFLEFNGLLAVSKPQGTEAPVESYLRVMWPGGENIDVAAPLTVASGSDVSVGNIKMVKRVLHKVRVKVTGAQCDKEKVFQVSFNQTTGSSRFTRATFNVACNEFTTLANMSPGKYEVVGTEHTGTQQLGQAGAILVELDGAAVDIELPVGPPIQLTGRVVLSEKHDEATLLPDAFAHLEVKLWPRGVKSYTVISILPTFDPAAVNDKGRFSGICYQTPSGGEIEVIIRGLPQGYYLRDVIYNGSKLGATAFELSPYAVKQDLQLVVSDQPGTVEGIVQLDSGVALVNAHIALVPSFPSEGDGLYPPNVIETTSDGKGHFRIQRLRPGKYRIVAADATLKDRLEEPGRLIGMLSRATEIEVQSSGVRNVVLRPANP